MTRCEDKFLSRNDMTDEQLCSLAGNGDEEATAILISRMISVIKIKAASFINAVPEADDLFQEGLIGLMYAIRSFDEDREILFRTYAGVCIGNRMASAVKTASRQKHIPLNSYISLSDGNFSIADSNANPEQLLIANESYNRLSEWMENNLSSFEKEVIRLYLGGHSYEYIAQQLGSATKSVDNALQRVRRKLRSFANSL